MEIFKFIRQVHLASSFSQDHNPHRCWLQVLMVQEKHYTPEIDVLWKLPTRFILESEEIFSGAVIQAKEETRVIAFRHAYNVAFEKSYLSFICMLRAVSSEIKIDDLEVQAANVKWKS